MKPNLDFYKQSKKIHGPELLKECELIKKAVHKFGIVKKDDEQLLIQIAERLNKSNYIRNVVFSKLKSDVAYCEMKAKMNGLKIDFNSTDAC